MTTRFSSRTLERQRALEKKGQQLDLALTAIDSVTDPPGFDVKFINDEIGSGLFTKQKFLKGSFLLQYKGDLISSREGTRREIQYATENKGSFLFFFKFKDRYLCVDATLDNMGKGRMINDAPMGDPLQNCTMKVVEKKGKPFLCVFATRNIDSLEELRYDYGVPTLPWRQKQTPYGIPDNYYPGNQQMLEVKEVKTVPIQDPFTADIDLKESPRADAVTEPELDFSSNLFPEDHSNADLFLKVTKDSMGKHHKVPLQQLQIKVEKKQNNSNLQHIELPITSKNLYGSSMSVSTIESGSPESKDGVDESSQELLVDSDKTDNLTHFRGSDMSASTIDSGSPGDKGDVDESSQELLADSGSSMSASTIDSGSPESKGGVDESSQDLLADSGSGMSTSTTDSGSPDSKGDVDESSQELLVDSGSDMSASTIEFDSPDAKGDVDESSQELLVDSADAKQVDVQSESCIDLQEYPRSETVTNPEFEYSLNIFIEYDDDCPDTLYPTPEQPYGSNEDDKVLRLENDTIDSITQTTDTPLPKKVSVAAEKPVEIPDLTKPIDVTDDMEVVVGDKKCMLKVNPNTGQLCVYPLITRPLSVEVNKQADFIGADMIHGTNDVDSDDSLNDPDFSEHESDISDFSDTCDEDLHSFQRKRKTLNNEYDAKRSKIALNERENKADSDSDEESVIIPDLSKFLDTTTKQTTKTLIKDVSNNKGQIKLLPKKPKQTGCKQVYDKINYCPYCKKGISSKISRHILSVHREKSRVSDILLLPKRSQERKIKLEILANEGNFKHNLEVLKKKEGFLAVARREKTIGEYKMGSYLPCNLCKKFILKTTLWLHQKNCSIGKFENSLNNENSSNYVRLSRQLLKSALLEEVDIGVSKLLSRMHHDEITLEVQQDDLIRRYAALKVESLGREQDQKLNDIHRISQSCRTLARVVLKCREKSEHIIDMDKLIRSSNFDLLVDTAKSMSLDDDKPAPSLGKLIGNKLSHIIQVKKGAALRDGNDKKLQEAENFERLFALEWTYRVNSVCQKMTNSINRQKVKTIPLTEDLQTLRTYILESMRKASDTLQKTSSVEIWTRLAKLTLCRLILFNKRRRAEVKDLKLKEYDTRPNWKEEQCGEFQMALSTSDRMLAKRMDMVISAGKSRKNVDAYIILPPDAKEAIERLNSSRTEAGISSENPYVFARPNSNTPLSGNGDLKEIVEQCKGIQRPERITSTGLRRYIATVSQILDMTDNELDSLARHMGHDVQTHKNHYRLSHATRELTIVSQLLMAVDDGCVNKWKGKQLKEISVEELPAILEEDDSDDNCDHDSDHDSDDDLVQEEEFPDAVEPSCCIPSTKATNNIIAEIPDAMEPSCCVPSPKVQYKMKSGRRSKKEPWSRSAEDYLRKAFHGYLTRTVASVHKSDIELAQSTCLELSTRTLAQIRTKLNNMKWGKSK